MNANTLGTGMMTKTSSVTHRIAVYELAKDLGIPHQDLVAKARSLGIDAKNHMSRLSPEDVLRLQGSMERERQENTVEERLNETVIRRRSKEPVLAKMEPVTQPLPPPRVFVRKQPSESLAKAVVFKTEVEEALNVHASNDVPKEKQTAVRAPSSSAVLEESSTSLPLEQPLVSEKQDIAAFDQPELSRNIPFIPKEAEVVEAPSVTTKELSMKAPVVPKEEAGNKQKELQRSEPKIPSKSTPATTSRMAPAAPSETKGLSTLPVRRSREGLGPTGRVIDLAALRPTPPAVPASSNTGNTGERSRSASTSTGRGPRQEVIVDRVRPVERERERDHGSNKGGKFHQKSVATAPKKLQQSTAITTAAEHKRVAKMGESIVIKDLANQLGIKATEILKEVWKLGNRNVMINSPIDLDTAQLVAAEFDWRVETNTFQEASVVENKADAAEDLKSRPPVITIMGHVDHGKTSLLDAIRNANVAAGEAGGITQHIGAYKIKGPAGEVVFLDTPGHEAFTEMRARGAQATDIVVLVVAADDGVMPQTIEALNHAKDAKVPIVIAVNKIDKPEAQPDRIRQQLSAYDLTPEEWGGQTIYVDVSARSRVGIDKLLEMLAIQAEVLELRANPNKPGKGLVIEARMDAKRGPVVTILVQEGTLRIGDTIVVGEEMGKVRAMIDDKGKPLAQAGPSTPVELLGLSGVPRAGDIMNAVSDERASKDLVEHRRLRRIDKERAQAGPVSLDRLMDAMKAGLKELKIILKADVQGSVEALSNALNKLSTPQVKITIIQAGVGGITETDVNLAKAGNAVILGFHVRPAGKASALAEQEGVDIKLYNIIYDAIEDIEKARTGLLAPIKREKLLGKAQVRQVYHMNKIGTIAGCAVSEGMIRRNAQVRLVRDAVQVFQGRLGSLKRFKEDVREVQQGYECGLSLEGFNDIKTGDIVECFEIEEIAPALGS